MCKSKGNMLDLNGKLQETIELSIYQRFEMLLESPYHKASFATCGIVWRFMPEY